MTLLMTVEITQLTLKKTSINTFNLSRATNGIYRAHDFTRHISGNKFSVGFLNTKSLFHMLTVAV